MGKTLRFSDWEPRLAQYILDHEWTQFRYGRFDCCLFAADAVKEICGVDLMAEERDFYRSARQARSVLSFIGGLERAVEFVTIRAGFVEVAILFAQRGDLVMARKPRPVCGIVDLSGVARFPSTDGLVRLPLRECARAWRIG